MAYSKKLGVFVKVPVPGNVKTRLIPPLTPDEACELYRAFLGDLFARLKKTKKMAGTVFYAGADPAALRKIVPNRFQLIAQQGDTLGERMENAFRHLLSDGTSEACLIGSDSPDIPLAYIKRAYLKLKHKDVVFGPACDGGYYLIGLKRVIPELFRDIKWSSNTVLRSSLETVRSQQLTCSLLPVWYDVDDVETLSLLRTALIAKQIERRDRLLNCERVIERIDGKLR
jgi:rSAM/selenodomain-associated transferase 1